MIVTRAEQRVGEKPFRRLRVTAGIFPRERLSNKTAYLFASISIQ